MSWRMSASGTGTRDSAYPMHQKMVRRQEEMHVAGVAALIEDGKVTGSYAGDQGIRYWEYILYGMMFPIKTNKE